MSATETVMIEDLDSFVRALSQWHKNQVAIVSHMMTIPDGAEVEDSENADGSPLVLTGAVREAFILGLKVALSELGELPFTAEMEEVNTTPDGMSVAAVQTELPLTH